MYQESKTAYALSSDKKLKKHATEGHDLLARARTLEPVGSPQTRSLKRMNASPLIAISCSDEINQIHNNRVFRSQSASLRPQKSGDLFHNGLEISRSQLNLDMTIHNDSGPDIAIKNVFGDQLCVVVFLRHFGCLVPFLLPLVLMILRIRRFSASRY